MYDPDDHYYRRLRKVKDAQRHWDGMTPPDDEQFDREFDARKDEHKRQREMHRKGVRDEDY